MKFRYKKQNAIYPIVPIKLYRGKNIWFGNGLIDSGAARSLFNSEVAKVLGIDLTKLPVENFGGVGNSEIKVKSTTVSFEVRDLKKRVTIKIGFVDNLVPPLLGQEGFFDNFIIKFDRARDTIEIT